MNRRDADVSRDSPPGLALPAASVRLLVLDGTTSKQVAALLGDPPDAALLHLGEPGIMPARQPR